jgi:hypothetical protein
VASVPPATSTAGQREREHEHPRAPPVVAHEVGAAAHAEGEAAIGRRVAHRRQRERGGVRPGGAQRPVQEQEQQRERERAHDADPEEPHERRLCRQPRDAPQVLQRRPHDLHPRVGIVDPVDRDLVDAQPAPLGEHQHLGVEEPAVVAHGVEQPGPQRVDTSGLEAALGVAEARPQHRVEE